MKTVIIGGGKGCCSLLSLTKRAFLKELPLEIKAVCDINPLAPGMELAEKMGFRTFTNIDEAIDLPNIELIIELTGRDSVLPLIYNKLRQGIRVIDHKIARIFWDVNNAHREQEWQLKELDKLEKKLERERFFLQSLFDSYADLVVVHDRDQIILRANKKFIEFAGKTKETTIGITCQEVLQNTALSARADENEHLLYQIYKSGKSHTTIKRIPPPNESHWEITRTPIFNKFGGIEYFLTVWHKITDQVMLRREIESAEMRFKSFIYSAQDWISIKDLDGKYLVVNPVIAKAYNRKISDFIGKDPEDILDKKLAKTIKFHDAEVIQTKQHRTYDEIIPVHGQDHHFQTVRFPLNDYKGEIIGVCTIARDVNRERRLQEQLVQSEKLASLGKLAAGVAHEINNPLTGILAYAEDLIDEFPPDDAHQDDFKVIIRETLRCRDIVRNLLDFARQDVPTLETINPNDIIAQSLMLVKRLPQFKDIIIDTRISDTIPKIQADQQQLLQVILNFMINAADAMNYKGEITISSEYDRKSSECIISVEDIGPGIPENLVDKLFEPFFSTKGTNGLGLAVSWGIIERHKGTIEVDTADTGGAIFRIVLPAYFVTH